LLLESSLAYSKIKKSCLLAANFLVENVLLLQSSPAFYKIKKMLPLAADFFNGKRNDIR
jgi:hypothetical protein